MHFPPCISVTMRFSWTYRWIPSTYIDMRQSPVIITHHESIRYHGSGLGMGRCPYPRRKFKECLFLRTSYKSTSLRKVDEYTASGSRFVIHPLEQTDPDWSGENRPSSVSCTISVFGAYHSREPVFLCSRAGNHSTHEISLTNASVCLLLFCCRSRG